MNIRIQNAALTPSRNPITAKPKSRQSISRTSYTNIGQQGATFKKRRNSGMLIPQFRHHALKQRTDNHVAIGKVNAVASEGLAFYFVSSRK
jgi:hypothetical protein